MRSPNLAKQRVPQLNFYSAIIRPLLFWFDAETMHHLVTKIAHLLWRTSFGRTVTRKLYAKRIQPMPVRLAQGLEFPNPLGLAAGFDKNALLVPGLESLGFGFIEIGTVTPRPQPGNPRPRMSRIPERRALLNRMGFPNEGAEIIAARLKKVREQMRVPVGVNLGKNKDTPNSEAIKDYETLFKAFETTASYFVVNISSPNTPGLRSLQSGDFVQRLGERIARNHVSLPVFVKIAPDILKEDLQAITALCGSQKPYAGLILTNTTPTDLGGLSGLPLKGASTAVLKMARALLRNDVPLISVGGIESSEDVLERFRLGANAVQLYSSLVYEGPSLPGRILRELQDKMRKDGIHDLRLLNET